MDLMLLDILELCVLEVYLKMAQIGGICTLNEQFIFSTLSFLPISVGRDLMKLYMTPAVQSYLNGIPAKDLNGDRAIYRHGTLRKVCGFVWV